MSRLCLDFYGPCHEHVDTCLDMSRTCPNLCGKFLECLVQCIQIHRHVSSMSNIFWVSLNLSGFLHLFESQAEKYNGMTSTHFQTICDTLSHTLHILFLQFSGLSKFLGMLVLCLPGFLCDVEPKFAAT